jgi:hypothetical protein
VFLLTVGAAGLLLCAGGAGGVFWLKGRVDTGRKSLEGVVDSLFDGVRAGVARAGPELASARARVAERLSEEAFAELRGYLLRAVSSMDDIARIAEAAAGLIELTDPGEARQGAVAWLRDRAGGLREVAGVLTGLRLREDAGEQVRPILARAEELLADVGQGLSRLRTRVAGLRNRVDRLLLGAVLPALIVLGWMALGQGCLVRAGWPRSSRGAMDRTC